MEMDRELQRKILELLKSAHPYDLDPAAFDELEELYGMRAVASALLYLEGHGLLISGLDTYLSGEHCVNLAKLAITSRGIDFIEDDGGLSAVLGVVTIKLHDDTIKHLIAARIAESDLPPDEKRKYLDHLRELPGEATKHLVLKLLDLALGSAPGALATVGKLLLQATSRT